MSARLTAYLPDGAAAECLLRAPSPLRIGRSGECRLVLDHASVSRLHADLEYGQGDWRLRDLDSKNGTFVDGVRIVAQALSGPSWLRFGDVTCQFQPLDATALARAEQRISARHSASLVHTLRVEQQKTLPDLLQATLTAVVELAGCERGFLLVDGSDGLSVRAWHGLQASTLGSPGFGGSVGAVQRALRERAPVIVNDLGNDAQLGARASVIAGGLRTLVCLPLSFNDEILGLAYADSRLPGSLVTTLDLELLQAFANRASLWIAARRSEAALDAVSRQTAWAGIAATHAVTAHERP